MEISMIWAEDEAGWIGKAQAVPWHLSADLKHFKAVTSGHPIIMGATTFLSLGRRPLPNRTNVVVTHRTLTTAGIEVVHSLMELRNWLAQATAEEVFIIGVRALFSGCFSSNQELSCFIKRARRRISRSFTKRINSVCYLFCVITFIKKWSLINECGGI